MKNKIWRRLGALAVALCILGAPAIYTTGCASANTVGFQSVGVADTVEVAAMTVWNAWVRANPTPATQAQNAQVGKIVADYAAAREGLQQLVLAWFAAGQPTSGNALIASAIAQITAVANNLNALVAQFTGKPAPRTVWIRRLDVDLDHSGGQILIAEGGIR